ncbi:hypothetical protein L9W92_02235 [Pelotomaculum terephthalicicum JT]|uniref:hypothetical protein n=1 Tax=Pelotomaculum TaxID=191373 RepID=UPI001F03F119|nr:MULTISPECIES: hypothetical protein [Pelotomaculum]MCG9966877.1 hypothetical protein [Pelotomaculum terephthalicicum JT]
MGEYLPVSEIILISKPFIVIGLIAIAIPVLTSFIFSAFFCPVLYSSALILHSFKILISSLFIIFALFYDPETGKIKMWALLDKYSVTQMFV